MEYKRWKQTFAINLDGTFLFIKYYLQQVEKYINKLDAPSIVLVGSTAGKFGEAYHAGIYFLNQIMHVLKQQ